MIIKNNKNMSEQERALFWVAKAAELNDETRYFMNGVLFRRRPDGTIMAVATDGRRLHMAFFPETVDWDVFINEGDGTHPTRIEKMNTRELVFGSEIHQTFPNYERVIPDTAYQIDVHTPARPELYYGYLVTAIQDAGHRVPRFEPKYITDAAEIFPNNVGFSTPDKAFTFYNHQDAFKRLAVIMPMRRDQK